MNDLNFDFQKRLYQLMKEKNISSKYQLAKMCGVECSVVSKWFIDGRHLQYDSLCKICPALNISISEFYNTSPSVSKNEKLQTLNRLWGHLNSEGKAELLSYASYLYKKEVDNSKI